MKNIISTGEWGSDASWELYHSVDQPPLALSTAVMCVAIYNGSIVLARNDRGWGLLGGHIEKGESHIDALKREAHEEGGFVIDAHEQFAVRKITNSRPLSLPGRRPYPFPISYMPFYWAITDTPPTTHYAEDIFESKVFHIDEITPSLTNDYAIILAGWKAFHASTHAEQRKVAANPQV
ncbi:MAG TPA: NUDIX domain-containing protein [Candidatus Saccharimonadales bacterium]|nr:NUDIX domain-containing protein [Candidatus Saccharimonadales bacterium]